MLCFAVFLGSWSPLASAGLKFSPPSPVDLASKTSVDYSTPSGGWGGGEMFGVKRICSLTNTK